MFTERAAPTPVTSRAGSRQMALGGFRRMHIPGAPKSSIFFFFFCIAFLRNLGILGPAVEATFKNSLLPAFSLAVEGEGGGLGKINCMLSVLKELELLFQGKC